MRSRCTGRRWAVERPDAAAAQDQLDVQVCRNDQARSINRAPIEAERTSTLLPSAAERHD
jgi:hypothetical protein